MRIVTDLYELNTSRMDLGERSAGVDLWFQLVVLHLPPSLSPASMRHNVGYILCMK